MSHRHATRLVRFDLWDDVYRLQLPAAPLGTRNTAVVTADAVVRQCTDEQARRWRQLHQASPDG